MSKSRKRALGCDEVDTQIPTSSLCLGFGLGNLILVGFTNSDMLVDVD